MSTGLLNSCMTMLSDGQLCATVTHCNLWNCHRFSDYCNSDPLGDVGIGSRQQLSYRQLTAAGGDKNLTKYLQQIDESNTHKNKS